MATKKWRFFVTSGGATIKFRVFKTETGRAYMWQSNQRPEEVNVVVVKPYYRGNPLLKIEDETKSHSYILNGIKNLKSEEIKNIDPNKNFVFDFGAAVKISQAEYKKQYLESRNDPNKSMRINLANSDMAQINIDGKMMNVSEYLRDREKQQKEKIAKDNNILELDLIK